MASPLTLADPLSARRPSTRAIAFRRPVTAADASVGAVLAQKASGAFRKPLQEAGVAPGMEEPEVLA